MTSISSRRNPLVTRYRAAARGDAGDVVLLDGAHLVTDALAAGARIREAAVTPEAADRPDIERCLARLKRAGIDAATVRQGVMDALSPVRSSSGIVALADRPDDDPGRLYRGANPLIVIGVDVQDPGNVGAIVRVLEAGGATGFVAAGACADPFGWKAMRGSMGSALRLPIAVQHDADAAIAGARRHGCRILAAVPRDGHSVFEMDYTRAVAILIGGEGPGLPPSAVAAADDRVTVPMHAPVESLNAAVTAALIVYEAFRHGGAASRANLARPGD
jgi:TrmH family RNA methyltransferase